MHGRAMLKLSQYSKGRHIPAKTQKCIVDSRYVVIVLTCVFWLQCCHAWMAASAGTAKRSSELKRLEHAAICPPQSRSSTSWGSSLQLLKVVIEYAKWKHTVLEHLKVASELYRLLWMSAWPPLASIPYESMAVLTYVHMMEGLHFPASNGTLQTTRKVAPSVFWVSVKKNVYTLYNRLFKNWRVSFWGPGCREGWLCWPCSTEISFFLLMYTTCHKRDNTYSELSEAVLNSVWDGVNLS